ncbi:hypothetical protein [Lactobacillus equicursoris]|uniref:hypothetical protein n=1 Tax=Lactobacillus equicursoris TaxID=420645 RepID=UPI00399562DF
MTDKRIHNLQAEVSNYEEVKAALPEDFDYIVDFVGVPENDPEKFKQINKYYAGHCDEAAGERIQGKAEKIDPLFLIY